MEQHLLLLSSSTAGNTGYLEHTISLLQRFVNETKISSFLFIPYAGVTINYDDYTAKVKKALQVLNIDITSIHEHNDPKLAIKNAACIVVGGGNTFALLNQLQENGLVELIKNKVNQGTPYIGWSAGSNIAGVSIKTTNDMPIVEPKSFDALNLISVQLNPHYIEHHPKGHHGETRTQRLEEFMTVNPETSVIAIVEGTAIEKHGESCYLVGEQDGYLFKGGIKTQLDKNASLSL